MYTGSLYYFYFLDRTTPIISMNNHRIAITGILLAQVIFFGIPTMAAEAVTVDTVDTSSSEWKECLTLLRIQDSIASVGTYRIRMVKCVNEKLRSKEVGDIDREHRLSLRARNVIDAFRAGSLGATARSVDIQKYTNSNYQSTDTEQQPTVRRFTRNVTPVQRTSTINSNYVRPSRRSIQSGAYSQSIADKKTESQVYQQRFSDALEACKEIDNHYKRNNCIRKKLRQSTN